LSAFIKNENPLRIWRKGLSLLLKKTVMIFLSPDFLGWLLFLFLLWLLLFSLEVVL